MGRNGNYEKMRKALVVGAVYRARPVRGSEVGAIGKVVERNVTDEGVMVKTVSISPDGRIRHNSGSELSQLVRNVVEILPESYYVAAENNAFLQKAKKEIASRMLPPPELPAFVPNEGPTTKALEIRLDAMKEEVRQLRLRVTELEGYAKVGRSATKPADPLTRTGSRLYAAE